MLSFQRPSSFVCRTLALTAVFGASVAVAGAQTETGTDAAAVLAKPTLNLQLSAAELNAANIFSSSSASSGDPDEVAGVTTDHLVPFNAMQYNGGRRYGRPRYRGGNTNADGSNKYEFFAGGGFTQPIGNTYHYYSPSYSFQVGAGRDFNKNFGLNLQFDWDNLAVNGRTIDEESYILSGDATNSTYNFDAHAHDWSFSIDPIYKIGGTEKLGAYVTAGAGFYHKVTQFTVPQTGEYCDYYGYCYEYTADSAFLGGTQVSNAPGFNGGFGLTYKLSRFSNERLYGEVRYVVTLNSQRQGYTYQNLATTTYSGYDYFPQNSNRTTYIPVKFGIRF